MKLENVERAAVIAEAIRRIPAVRESLGRKPTDADDRLWLRVEAFEGDENGGSVWANLRLDKITGETLLDGLETFLSRELQGMGVEIVVPEYVSLKEPGTLAAKRRRKK